MKGFGSKLSGLATDPSKVKPATGAGTGIETPGINPGAPDMMQRTQDPIRTVGGTADGSGFESQMPQMQFGRTAGDTTVDNSTLHAGIDPDEMDPKKKRKPDWKQMLAGGAAGFGQQEDPHAVLGRMNSMAQNHRGQVY